MAPDSTVMSAALRRWRIPYKVTAGVDARTAGGVWEPRYVMWHHTADGSAVGTPTLGLVTSGRSDLAGPLCQWYVSRPPVGTPPTVYLVASGRANHAGAGQWRGIPVDSGNRYCLGIEWENTGTGEPWDDYWNMQVLAAALECVGTRDAQRMCGHKEYAPTRKIDPAGVGMDAARSRLAAVIAAGPSPTTTAEDDVSYDDAVKAVRDVLHLPVGGLAVPQGQRDNGNAYVNLLGGMQANVNSVNAIRAGVGQVLAVVGPLANDEPVILAALAALPTGGRFTDAQVEEIAAAFPQVDYDRIRDAVQFNVTVAPAG